MIICDTCNTEKPTKNYCSGKCRVEAFRKKADTKVIKQIAKEVNAPARQIVKPKKPSNFKVCKHGTIINYGLCKFGCTQ